MHGWEMPGKQFWPGAKTIAFYNDFTLAVHAVLRDWFDAMEQGTAVHRMPDPDYGRPHDKPAWTEHELDALVREFIDSYVFAPVQRTWAVNNLHINPDAGPGFSRLALPQRLAFAQELDQVCERFHDHAATAPRAAPPPPPLPDDLVAYG